MTGRRVALVAGGLAPFGVRAATWSDLVQEAGRAAFKETRNFSGADVDSLFVGAAQPERWAFQSHVAPLAAELLGIRPWKIIQRTELACASGQAAIRSAYAAIAAGLSDVAVACGVEKMNIPSMAEATTSMANVLDRPWDGVHGATAPPFFAMVAQRHMMEHGTTAEQMTDVSVKNHRFANANPNAQFHAKVFSKEKLLGSPMISPPLRLGDCSSMTDGAGAVLLVAEEKARQYTDTPIWIAGSAQHSDFHNLSNMPNLTDWVGLRRAGQELYRSGRVGPQDIDVAEVHDCFTISEIIEYEALGFCPPGAGGKFVAEGQSDLGGKVVVNPRGGLLGCGHPLGATGIAQAVEIFQQLQGSAPPARQAPGAEVGLVHNLSGSANVHSLMLYRREN